MKPIIPFLCLALTTITVVNADENIIATSSSTPTTANGKNLIWIITDEHNLRTLGCYRETMSPEQANMWGAGNVVQTPNIDSMARNGTLFTCMHPSTPTCTPSRGSMFTGIYPQNLGIHNNSNKVGERDLRTLRSNLFGHLPIESVLLDDQSADHPAYVRSK